MSSGWCDISLWRGRWQSLVLSFTGILDREPMMDTLERARKHGALICGHDNSIEFEPQQLEAFAASIRAESASRIEELETETKELLNTIANMHGHARTLQGSLENCGKGREELERKLAEKIADALDEAGNRLSDVYETGFASEPSKPMFDTASECVDELRRLAASKRKEQA